MNPFLAMLCVFWIVFSLFTISDLEDENDRLKDRAHNITCDNVKFQQYEDRSAILQCKGKTVFRVHVNR